MRVTRKQGKIDALRAAAKALDGAQSKVGWFASAQYEGGQPVAGVAHVQEFGSPKQGIPARPFFRTTAAEKRNEWAQTAADVARAAALGKIPAGRVMEAVAMASAGHVAATISKLTTPPLSPSTVAARKRRLADKGKSLKGAKGGAGVAGIVKPLVDSGILINTLAYEFQGVETRIANKK